MKASRGSSRVQGLPPADAPAAAATSPKEDSPNPGQKKKSKSRTQGREGPGDSKGGLLLTKMPSSEATPLLPGVPVAGVHPLPAKHRKEESALERVLGADERASLDGVLTGQQGGRAHQGGVPPTAAAATAAPHTAAAVTAAYLALSAAEKLKPPRRTNTLLPGHIPAHSKAYMWRAQRILAVTVIAVQAISRHFDDLWRHHGGKTKAADLIVEELWEGEFEL